MNLELASYIKQAGGVTAFSRKTGLSRRTIYDYIEGKKRPSGKTMQKIIDVTAGELLPNDFFIIPDNTDSPQQNHVEQGV